MGSPRVARILGAARPAGQPASAPPQAMARAAVGLGATGSTAVMLGPTGLVEPPAAGACEGGPATREPEVDHDRGQKDEEQERHQAPLAWPRRSGNPRDRTRMLRAPGTESAPGGPRHERLTARRGAGSPPCRQRLFEPAFGIVTERCNKLTPRTRFVPAHFACQPGCGD